MHFRRDTVDGLTFFTPKRFPGKGIKVVFTTRIGGISREPYDSLNLAFHTNDQNRAVMKNRERLAAALHLDPGRITFARQVHGGNVVWVREEMAGAGAESNETAIADCDAMLTGLSGPGLMVLSADCLPIILVDPGAGIIAAAHAGWRGTLARIAEKTVADMAEAGAKPESMQVFFGPSIGECCYEVSLDLYGRFAAEFNLPSPGQKQRLNLARINQSILVDAGVPAGQIVDIGLCTSCHPDLFYSWRRDRITGRQGSLVARELPR